MRRNAPRQLAVCRSVCIDQLTRIVISQKSQWKSGERKQRRWSSNDITQAQISWLARRLRLLCFFLFGIAKERERLWGENKASFIANVNKQMHKMVMESIVPPNTFKRNGMCPRTKYLYPHALRVHVESFVENVSVPRHSPSHSAS